MKPAPANAPTTVPVEKSETIGRNERRERREVRDE